MGNTLDSLPPDLRARLARAVERIVEIAHPQQVILFGSYAEGNASAELREMMK